ncbi:MAG: hypothetical protein R2879_19310 [Saprospiraceae bacterium]
MKIFWSLLMVLGFSASGFGQDVLTRINGEITFMTSTRAYVLFESTTEILKGDTLFFQNASGSELIPVLLVDGKSSSKVVGLKIGESSIEKGDIVYAFVFKKKKEPEKDTKEDKSKAGNERVHGQPLEQKENPLDPAELNEQKRLEALEKDSLRQVKLLKRIEERKKRSIGRVSIGLNSNFNNRNPNHTLRYNLSFRDGQIGNSNFSTENYIVFRHQSGEWSEVQENVFNALRIYSLGIQYNFKDESNIWVGRKINPNFASMGAVDGLQGEKTLGNFALGGIIGSRPDFRYYDYNPSLFQTGAYVRHASKNQAKYSRTTLGFLQQMNNGNIDRRYMYFQHSDALLTNLNFFGSFEADLYENLDGKKKNVFRLTNFFVNLRYRPFKNLTLSTFYDNRNNTIFYETFRSYIDNLIDQETRQGLRFGIQYRPFRMMSVGVNSNFRFQSDGGNKSRNFNGYLSYSKIPLIGVQASLTANMLESSFNKSLNYGLRLTRDIWDGKISGSLYFRKVKIEYLVNDRPPVLQDLAEFSLYIRISKQFSLSLTGEETFNRNDDNTGRFYARITQRF